MMVVSSTKCVKYGSRNGIVILLCQMSMAVSLLVLTYWIAKRNSLQKGLFCELRKYSLSIYVIHMMFIKYFKIVVLKNVFKRIYDRVQLYLFC